VRAESDGRQVTVYAETLRRTDAATREALTAYQQRAQLPPTGLPDQATLFRLTYRGETASGSDEATR
jgi:peptidoglycan hydrolase-like protein with peptidoglycan-binding domain